MKKSHSRFIFAVEKKSQKVYNLKHHLSQNEYETGSLSPHESYAQQG